ncbi:7-carboxy-7-deazaguanine synthase QueE [Spongiactinospora sp. 9N601]|uniref:7-carboxy-7-deazaguanine synthase QueE n=1 Tax=Spongiactinospora sp. 9N601 TaxID=3375149 RepID=UPI00378F0B78
MTAARLLVAETFGPTLQGEGPSCGRQAMFIRLSRCNLRCSYCDTPYTWDWDRYDPRHEARWQSVAELAEWVGRNSPRLVVITGGEPLLQQDRLVPLLDVLLADGRRVEIETNGTIAPALGLVRDGVQFNVSPKLSTAGLAEDHRIVPAALTVLANTGNAIFKFVATEPADLAEVAELEEQYALASIWVMPEGTTIKVVLDRARQFADQVIARGWNLSLRLQVLLWEAARGR